MIDAQRRMRYDAPGGALGRAPTERVHCGLRARPALTANAIPPTSSGTAAPARTVRRSRPYRRAPMRWAATMAEPLKKPDAAKTIAMKIALAAVAPARATAPRLPMAIVSTVPKS